MRNRKYGYAIVDAQGKPWWDETCVCQDRGPLAEQVDEMNYEGKGYDPRVPYKVVAVYWRSK